jgi:hypothetical protein
VIGSQSILGSFTEDELPEPAVCSIEADLAFFDDPDNVKSDEVDGAIGEDSQFHATFGYYGQAVSVTTAVLPVGWRDRIVVFDSAETEVGGRALRLAVRGVSVKLRGAPASRDSTAEPRTWRQQTRRPITTRFAAAGCRTRWRPARSVPNT